MKLKTFILFLLLASAAGIYAQTVKAPASYPKPELYRQHSYHQTLMMKLFLSEVDADKGEGRQLKKRDKGESKVALNFEQALEVIRKMDNLTLGIPKIVYLVGWQYNGHDSKYPAWGEVNPKLKRPQDKTALESMQWLMSEAFRYNTTVSVHINMFDAYDDSPLWDTYIANDIIARNTDGSLRSGEWGWPISYTQEWNTGYAQKRIDAICEMLPLSRAGTVHIDAFHSWAPFTPNGSSISPYLGFTAEQESETQEKIFHYWASKGIDVTSEGTNFLRISAFEGLQPAAWWFNSSVEEYMKWPASYYCGGANNNSEGLLFGKSMHGEDVIRKDPEQLTGFLQQFCTQTLPWYYLNRLQRLEYNQTKNYRKVQFSGGVTTRLEGMDYSVKKDEYILRHNGNVFMPALWMNEPAFIAYSTDGYDRKTWRIPADRNDYTSVDMYQITTDGLKHFQQNAAIKEGEIILSLKKDEALLLVPSGIRPSALPKDTISVTAFGLKPNTRENAVPYVQKAIEACRKVNDPILVFPAGRYDFWPHHCVERDYYESNTTDVNPKRLAILIEEMNELIIDGLGSEFVFHDRMQPFTIDHSNHITIRNLNIDWDIPLTAQAMVETATESYIDLRINAFESPYVIEDGKLVFVGEGWKSRWWGVIEFDKSTLLIVPQTADNVFGGRWNNYRAEEVEKGLVRLHHNFKRIPEQGNLLVLRHSERDHAGVFITDSKDVQLEHIDIYHTAGLGVLAQYAETLTYRHVNHVPNLAKGRILAGHDDGFHFSNCKGQITVDSCRFHGLMDDPINVHGTGVRIINLSGNKLRCQFMHHQSEGLEWARAGDTIGFIDHQSMHTAGVGVVKSFTPIDRKLFDLELEPAAPAANQTNKGRANRTEDGLSSVIPASIRPDDGLENLSWTPAVTITNSFVGSCRARGFLISTPGKVMIENNIFESSGSAILIAGDANYWYETGAVKDVTIRGNVFRAPNLTSIYQFCEAVISIFPEVPKPDLSLPYHRNITITGNEFHLFDYPIVYAKSVQGLVFSHNKLIRSYDYEPYHSRKAGLTFESCRQVQVLNNEMKGDILGTNIHLIKTPKKEVCLDKKGVFKF